MILIYCLIYFFSKGKGIAELEDDPITVRHVDCEMLVEESGRCPVCKKF